MIALCMFLVAGIFLGVWDILKKVALKDEEVISVLAAYSILSFVLVCYEMPHAVMISGGTICLLAVKSLIIYVGWNLMFLAIQKLPISVIIPFNTVTPLFSIILGIIVLGEMLKPMQWVGIVIMFVAYYFISKVGKFEVEHIFRNKYFYYMIIGSICNGISSLIDKIVIAQVTETLTAKGMAASLTSPIVQVWFLCFMMLFYGVTYLGRKYVKKEKLKLKWSWSILGMSVCIILADRIYFAGLNMPNTPISIAMPLRSVSIVVSVLIGGLIFKEPNLKKKLLCTAILILGIVLVFV
ncbi:DMT family transporter [Cellulosilyticum ruminicola]|uniref:DMT family transporter n=1 Tax=Cellulosilyticum ruminicola TaxID=425254 RepID=UPI0006D2C5AD|nr:DMT family transporter [Cellulosilyticum ruminicola]